MKIDRLLAIVILLLDKKLISAGELAKRFSVSIRTIQRDMETLNLAGIPVYSMPGQSGGYGILPEYKIDNRLLSNDDILNLITALKSVQGTFADKRFLGSLEQICSLVPPQIRERVTERENSLYIDFSLSGGDTILAEKIRTIESAIHRSALVRCRYTSNKQDSTVRVLEPMTLILQWGSWYLFAYCRSRSDFRLFRIGRMHDIAVETERFARRGKTYREFTSERPDFGNQSMIDLAFVADASVRGFVEERHPSHELEYREDGSVVVRCRRPEEERMYQYLLSYGNGITVIDPPHVRARLRKIAREVFSNYDTQLS